MSMFSARTIQAGQPWQLPHILCVGRQYACFTVTLSDFIQWIDLSFPYAEPKLRRGNASLTILHFALTLEMARTSLRVSSTDSDVVRTRIPSLQPYWILFATHNENHSRHTGDLVEHTKFFHHNDAYSTHDVLSKMF